jgi:tetratricopeptide (TPR) repeat protein
MGDSFSKLKDLVFGSCLNAWRRGDRPAAIAWLGLYLLPATAAALWRIGVDAARSLGLISQLQLWALAAMLCLFLYVNILVFWVADDPSRATQVLVAGAARRRFRRTRVKAAKRLRWPFLLVTMAATAVGARATWLYLPRFPSDPERICIYVARFWDPGAPAGSSPQSDIAQATLIEAIESEARSDAALRQRVDVMPLAQLLSPVDSAEGERRARDDARRGHADLVVWGSVLGAESKQYRVRISLARDEVTLEATSGVHAVLIAKDPCPPELSQVPLLAARFALAYAQYNRGDYIPAIPLLEAVMGAISRSSAQSQYDSARLAFYLGTAHLHLGLRDPAHEMPTAVAYYRQVLLLHAEQASPLLWAGTMHDLGTAYTGLPGGDRSAALREAIKCFEAALQVRTERMFPSDWAMTMNNIGVAYKELPRGDRSVNVNKAIRCFEAALHVYTERAFPSYWAMTTNNLGGAYTDLPSGDRSANLGTAIGCYGAALRVLTEQAFPAFWAGVTHNLGAAYAELPDGDRTANLQRAIKCYEAALRVYTERAFPRDWARTMNSLGNAYTDLPGGDRTANLGKAIECHAAALRVYTERAFPGDWAGTMSDLGNAYTDLGFVKK